MERHRRKVFALLSILLIILHSACLCFCKNSASSCLDKEREALFQFKQDLSDPSGSLSSWNGEDCCLWKGVTCDGLNGHVVKLQIMPPQHSSIGDPYTDSYKLTVIGELNSSLLNLKYLNYLDLSGIYLTRIPEFFGSLKELKYLNLSSTQFKGAVPHQFGNLTKLEVLDISGPYIGGIVADIKWLSRLQSLKFLDMSGVNLSKAQHVIEVLSMIPSLSHLSLSSCSLSDFHLSSRHLANSTSFIHLLYLNLSGNDIMDPSKSTVFQNMTSLVYLDLSYNSFQTIIEGGLFHLLKNKPYLKSLLLQHNNIEGKIATIFKNTSEFINLEELDLSYNSIKGYFPNWLVKLKYLRLDYNSFSSPILKDIGELSNLLELGLSNNQLIGTIPSSLGKLSSLTILDLADNQLTGSIPESLGQLQVLESLLLSNNYLSGTIPNNFGELSNLLELGLSNNQLIGTIPSSLGKLSSLTILDLADNQLMGSIPESLGQLQVLESLLLSNNYLSGTIPNNFGELSNLQYLSLSDNSLRGIISETHFSKMSRLKILDISNNHLTFKVKPNWTPPFQLKELYMHSCEFGTTFPEWMQTQVELQSIMLFNTSIFGNLPRWLANMSFDWMDLSYNQISGSLMTSIPSSCTFVDLSQNLISGSLPTNISRLSKWKYLYLYENHINGTIPSSLCGVQLRQLDLANNKLYGRIPDCWNLTEDPELDFLRLSYNHLSGFIPNSIGNLGNLMSLNLNENNFNGELPMFFQNCSLPILDLGENNLTGNIPACSNSKSVSYMYILRLRGNRFSGIIPPQLCSLSQLQILDLASNNLQGPIPNCIGNISAMAESKTRDDSFIWSIEKVAEVVKGLYQEYTSSSLKLVAILDLSGNQLTGPIPRELTSLRDLHGLNLSHNNLSGGIPIMIGEMKSLESLDLSNNYLSGRIPQSISTLTFLSHLNLSCNNFTGPIPKGNQIQTLDDPSIYAGNPLLCGDLLRKKCFSTKAPPVPKISPDHGRGSDQADTLGNVLFYVAIMLGFGTGLWGFIGVLVFKKEWRRVYFSLTDRWIDRAYVTLVLMVVRLKRRSRNN